jgi:hypothetical protein
MRKSLLFAAAAVLAFGSTAWAGPKDKFADSLVDASSVAGTALRWNNTVTSGTVSQKGCKIQVKLKSLGTDSELADGKTVICLAEATARAAVHGGNSVVLSGLVKKGQVKMKADLTQVGCGTVTSGAAIAYNTGFACYLEDLIYTGPNTGQNWENICGDAGMVPIAPTVPDGKTALNLIGLCQSLSDPDARITPPTSAKLCEIGVYTAPGL